MPMQIFPKKENPVVMKNINEMKNYDESQAQNPSNYNKTNSKKNIAIAKPDISPDNKANAARPGKKSITIDEKNR
jgi:hypothetical protein